MTRTVTVAAVALLTLLAGCAGTPDSAPAPEETLAAKPTLTKPNRGDDLLFVARSQSAHLTLDGAGTGTLKMADVPTMTWFSDRPKHDAGTTATTDALAAFGWKKNGDSLGQQAPNAALTADNLEESTVLELLSASRTGDEVTFKVAAVTKGTGKAPRDQSLSTAELFIDSVLPCDGDAFAAVQLMRSRVQTTVETTTAKDGTGLVLVTFYVMQNGAKRQLGYPFGPDVDDTQYTFRLTEDQPMLQELTFTIDGKRYWGAKLDARPSPAPFGTSVALSGRVDDGYYGFGTRVEPDCFW